MTVSLYTGHVGSGKSYEVVKFVILPALERGRAVVSNIDGLNQQAISDYLEAQGCEQPGDLVCVGREEMARSDFFPVRKADGSYVASRWVPLGALVVIDEAHHLWGADNAVSKEHFVFLTEHRHITAEDGTACDLVLISQAVGQVALKVKRLIQFSVDCKQLRALGLTKKYSTCVYEGYKQSGRFVMSRATKTYDPKIFKLYSSFAAKNGKVLNTDKRFSIWNNKLFWMGFVVAVGGLIGSVGYLVHSVSPKKAAPSVQTPAEFVTGQVQPVAVGIVSAAVPGKPAGPSAGFDIGGESKGPVSVWRIVGRAEFKGDTYAVLRRTGFPLRYLPARFCLAAFGKIIQCVVSGEHFEPEGDSQSSGGGSSGESTWAVDKLAAKNVKVH